MRNFIILNKQKVINYYKVVVDKLNLKIIFEQYKSIAIMIGLLLLLILFNHGIKYIFNFKKHVEQKLVVKAEPAIKTNLPIIVHATGKVNSINNVNIFPQMEGKLLELFFKEGSMVNQDELLFEIDPGLPQAEYLKAEANLAIANADLNNVRLKLQKSTQLYAKKFVSLQEQEQAIANFDIATANQKAAVAILDASKIKLGFSKIYAPISGIIGEIFIKPGNIINSSNLLATINQVHPIQVVFSIAEKYLPDLLVKFNNLDNIIVNIPELQKSGKLTFVNNQVDNLTGTILLKAEFCNCDLKLWPGKFVHIDLNIKQLENVITIPSVAVQVGQESSYVYIAELLQQAKNTKLAKIKKVNVKLGEMNDQLTVINQGLKAGDLVVTEGYANLTDQLIVELYVP